MDREIQKFGAHLGSRALTDDFKRKRRRRRRRRRIPVWPSSLGTRHLACKVRSKTVDHLAISLLLSAIHCYSRRPIATRLRSLIIHASYGTQLRAQLALRLPLLPFLFENRKRNDADENKKKNKTNRNHVRINNNNALITRTG